MSLFQDPVTTPVDAQGDPYAGAKRYFYLAGTLTPATVYADAALTTALSNPVVANASGQFVPIFLDPAVSYRTILRDASDVLLRDNDNITTSTITAATIGIALYPRTTAEISASVIPTDYQYPEGNVKRYGAVGDGSTDDTAAIRRAVSVMNVKGGGVLNFPPGNYVVFTSAGDDGDLCALANLTGISVLGYGATITVSLARVLTDSKGALFEFDSCDTITVDGFTTAGPTLDVSSATVKGYEFVRCINGCRNVSMPNNRVANMIAGFITSKGGTDADILKSKNIHIGVLDVSNSWYGVAGVFSGDNLRVDCLRTDTIHRSVFIYGASNIKINVWSKDHKSTDVRLHSAGITGTNVHNCSDIEVNYHSASDSTACGGAAKVYVGPWGQSAQIMRNIRVNLAVEYAGSGTTGASAFVLTKLTDAAAADTNTSRGHKVENLTVSGTVIGTPSETSLGGVIGTDANCDWTGDTLSTLAMRDVKIDGASAFSYIQWAVPGLADTFVLDNVVSDYAVNIIHNNSTTTLPRVGRVELQGVSCLNRHTDDGTNLSLDNLVAGSTTPTAYAGWMNGKTLTMRGSGGDCIWALPAATPGMEFRAVCTTADRLSLDPNGSEVIRGGGAGKIHYTDDTGGAAHYKCFTAGTWEVIATYGTWAFEP